MELSVTMTILLYNAHSTALAQYKLNTVIANSSIIITAPYNNLYTLKLLYDRLDEN